MQMYVPDINEIWEEILSEKLIKKNRQYGNSVYDEDTTFSNVGDPEELIKIRLDDKMRRLKTLDPLSDKYDSELMEIIAYLMHLLNWRRNSGKYEEEELKELGQYKIQADKEEEIWWEDIPGEELRPVKLATGRNPSSDRQPRDEEQSSRNIREICDDFLPFLGLRRLPSGERRRLREEDFQ